MNTEMLKMSRRLWNSSLVPNEINRSNQIKWVRAIKLLGDKWLMKQQVQRRT